MNTLRVSSNKPEYDGSAPEESESIASSQFYEDCQVRDTEEDEEDHTDTPMGSGGQIEERDEFAEIRKLAQAETRRVLLWKGILLTVIGVTAALVTAGTYRILRQEEDDDFTTAYRLFSNNIKDAIQGHYERLSLASRSASLAITGSAQTSQETFPYVTIKDFEVLGESIRERSGLESLTWTPFVPVNEEGKWNNYSAANQGWVDYSRKTVLAASDDEQLYRSYQEGPIGPMFKLPGPPQQLSAPVWQQSPPPFSVQRTLNLDLMTTGTITQTRYNVLARVKHLTFGDIDTDVNLINSAFRKEDHELYHARKVDWNKSLPATDLPHSFIAEPVFSEINDPTSELVGQVIGYVALDNYVVDLLPDGINNITLVMRNSCNQTFTYDIRGSSAYYYGSLDLHDPQYDDLEVTTKFYGYDDEDIIEEMGQGVVCTMTFHIYPTSTFEDNYRSNLPMILAILVGATFAFMAVTFFMYDWFQGSRNRKVVAAAASSNAIVSSMFPSVIRDKLLEQQKREQREKRKGKVEPLSLHSQDRLSLQEEGRGGDVPLADFYPACTIMFCDIVGFTAWSSVREPVQVFQLLEAVYAEFDKCANNRRVFKVETVGDSYVAVAGLPEARKDHAVAMCRFAQDCKKAFTDVVNRLEMLLGPETADLSMRFGLHSGPVTAGVLRGDKARFQLFGDTMNTASRMESTGKPGVIQVSHDTAEILKEAGKGAWVTPREEMVQVKGKGMLITYWLAVNAATGRSRDGSSTTSGTSVSSEVSDAYTWSNQSKRNVPINGQTKEDQKTQRLVQWNVGVLSDLLSRVIAAHKDISAPANTTTTMGKARNTPDASSLLHVEAGMPLDEVKEVISISNCGFQPSHMPPDEPLEKLNKVAKTQLHDYVSTIAAMYKDNAFHNFEHASQVAMAECKLLSRVVNPKLSGVSDDNPEGHGSTLHDSYGITSDPLVQFACVFSALIHDVDHPGVPNSTLLSENEAMAQTYGKRSMAEQQSFDLAWNLLMDARFNELKLAICGDNTDELNRFRQILINVVLATDVMDKDLNELRAKRWDRSFGTSVVEEAKKDKIDRKATVVIEHMIQAADVAHTMQHWHIYHKWNSRLFSEMYSAYSAGRTTENPAEGWYEGELGFFDTYIIPLAKKLDECGVFGVASSEYLSYAERNRMEWEDKGKFIVEEYLQEYKAASDAVASKDTIMEDDEREG
mmetsp:Transcript_27767/g.64985  ORF Transcript_27767/g.64985 Transcript_27767/m.64985 type:complete len:1198 (+) Transcript_27767:98-3691(+)